MASTNPHRGLNKTDFHMCGSCGKLLYLTGRRRVRRFFLLVLPTFIGVAVLGFSVLRNIEGLNIYREAREAYEPNFLGFLLMCAAIYIAVSLLLRFESVGVAESSETEVKQPRSTR